MKPQNNTLIFNWQQKSYQFSTADHVNYWFLKLFSNGFLNHSGLIRNLYRFKIICNLPRYIFLQKAASKQDLTYQETIAPPSIQPIIRISKSIEAVWNQSFCPINNAQFSSIIRSPDMVNQNPIKARLWNWLSGRKPHMEDQHDGDRFTSLNHLNVRHRHFRWMPPLWTLPFCIASLGRTTDERQIPGWLSLLKSPFIHLHCLQAYWTEFVLLSLHKSI